MIRETWRHRWWMIRALVLTVVLASLYMPAWADDDEKKSDEPTIEEKVDILTEELSRLREQMNIPETDEELHGAYGMGPAASKVYGVSQGISFGGYGEFYFASPFKDTDATGKVNVTDFFRFIAYIGYKFNESIIMNAEIEYEHATTSSNFQGKSGSVSVEFAYLDFLLNPAFNVRAGNLLVPMAQQVNSVHRQSIVGFGPFVQRRGWRKKIHEGDRSSFAIANSPHRFRIQSQLRIVF